MTLSIFTVFHNRHYCLVPKLFYVIVFIYFGLHWVFVASCGLSLIAASRGYSWLWCVGFSFPWLLLLWSTGSRHTGFTGCGTQTAFGLVSATVSADSVVMSQGLSCSMPCGIFLNQWLNLWPLHWQAYSYPLHHQGNPRTSSSVKKERHPY